MGCSAPGRPRLTAWHFPQGHVVGAALDEGREEIRELVTESHLVLAPKKLTALFG